MIYTDGNTEYKQKAVLSSGLDISNINNAFIIYTDIGYDSSLGNYINIFLDASGNKQIQYIAYNGSPYVFTETGNVITCTTHTPTVHAKWEIIYRV